MTAKPITPTLHDAVTQRAAAAPDAPALIVPDDGVGASGRIISYAEAERRIVRMAAALRAQGVRNGDRVATRLEKSADGLLLFFAVLQAGGVYVPVNPAFTPREAEMLIEEAAPVLLIDNAPGDLHLSVPAPRLAQFGTGAAQDIAEGADAAEDDTSQPLTGLDDPAAMLFTSGTTGQPKGAVLTHHNLMTGFASLADAWEMSAADRVLHLLPVFHAHGLFLAAALPLTLGASVIVCERFDAERAIALLPDATILMAVPAIYTRLLARPSFDVRACAGLRLATSGSAPLSPEVFAALRERMGLNVVERYGMTETTILTSNPIDGTARVGSVGQALSNVELRIADADGAVLPTNEVGHIEARGPSIIKGYWNRPQADSDWTDDGFFRTGDMGRLDDDGFLWLVGRQKDLIISGGFNVYPREVEIQIEMIPGVDEAVVFGVSHPDFGEGVVAAIRPDGSHAIDMGTINMALAKTLAKYKRPKHCLIMDDFPRNSLGKVLKKELREAHANLFGGSVS